MDTILTDEFLQSLRLGDEDSFCRLYETYGPAIYRLAYRMTNQVQDAEEITQETFLQVYRTIGTFRGECSLSTWMYTIAKNLCFRTCRKQNKVSFSDFETMIQQAARSDEPAGLTPFEKQYLINQVKNGCLSGLLRCLSLQQRVAFILRVLFHLPIPLVARELDKSEGATKVLVHRARANLKTFLCNNCSQYADGNPCRCQDMLQFSLHNGWIHRGKDIPAHQIDYEAQHVEAEIREIRAVTELYRELDPPLPAENLTIQLQQAIHETRLISQPEKV